MVMLKIQPNSKICKIIDKKTQDLIETLDWVGIESMKLPIKYRLKDLINQTAAKIDVFVSLDRGEFKGIDMAELFFNTQSTLTNQELDFSKLDALTLTILKCHKDRSLSSKIKIDFDLFLEKPTLRSNEIGIQAYPLGLEFINSNNQKQAYIYFEVVYASTCPCSEAASRKENLEKFVNFLENSTNPKQDFENWYLDSKNSFAHPHAQKSIAKFKLEIDTNTPGLFELVNSFIVELEDTIQTSVHGAVRQEDEAAFTTKMGDNLIFIEDAAKKFKDYIKNRAEILSSCVELIHNESIHPHNAKVFFTT
jgi:GTP cyclohydrolase I